jgi:hypothetical protein
MSLRVSLLSEMGQQSTRCGPIVSVIVKSEIEAVSFAHNNLSSKFTFFTEQIHFPASLYPPASLKGSIS